MGDAAALAQEARGDRRRAGKQERTDHRGLIGNRRAFRLEELAAA